MDPLGALQWQTWRIAATEDTLLTDYKPADITTVAVKKKMIGVYPASAIIIKAFGKDTDGDSATVVISGWMDQGRAKGGGPGQRLWRGQLLCGSKSFSHIPLGDEHWGAAATWFDVDTWDEGAASGYDIAGASRLEVANQECALILPTLGYTHLLLEVRDLDSANEMTEIGFIWRPVRIGEVVRSI